MGKNVKRLGVHRGLDRLKVSLRSTPCRIHEKPISKPAPRGHQLNVKVKAQSIESLREDHEVECTVHCKPKLPNNNMKQQLEELENEMALQQHQIALLEDQRIRLEEEKTVDALQ